jgi:hypothetical protein
MSHRLASVVTLLAVLALVVGIRASRAQDDPTPTPAAAPAATPPPAAHPVAIHQGTCQQPVAEPAYDLGTAGPPTDEQGQPIPPQGVLTAPPLLEAAAEDVEYNLGDLLASGQPYVVIVHQSAEEFTTYLACGELAGPFVDNQLEIALRPVGNAGFAGVATFEGGDDTTTSVVYVITELLGLSGGQTAGTPQPQPTPVAAQGTIPPTPSPSPVPTDTPAPTATIVVEVTATPAA